MKNKILEILENELEVFDPICDGPVEIAEGLALLYEDVKLFSDKDDKNLISYLKKKYNKLSNSEYFKIGYKNGMDIIKSLY